MIYDYKCQACGEYFHIEAPISSKRVGVKCAHCKSTRVKRLIPKIAVIFKGSGFYSTDNKK